MGGNVLPTWGLQWEAQETEEQEGDRASAFLPSVFAQTDSSEVAPALWP